MRNTVSSAVGHAQQRLSCLPPAFSPADLAQLLAAFDRRTATGRRDYAIARCYVDLGLRTAKISRPRLDDIDWQQGQLQIRGNARRIDVFPLPRLTGRPSSRTGRAVESTATAAR